MSQWFITCYTTRYESPNNFKRVAPQTLAILILCNKASNSASLLDACGKLICSTYYSLSPCGNISTTPALAPSILLDLSKYIVQTLDKSGGLLLCNSSHSAIKSGRTWELMAFLFSYVMSKGESSIPHKETCHVASGLFNIFDSGAPLTTMIGWTAKNCRSFLAVMNMLYASFW
jgi:hypothetical protein